MKHPFNGRRLSECRLDYPLVAIVVLPLNGMFPPLDASSLTQPQDMVRPLQQVTLRPDKLSAEGFIRLGETPNDEANCWIHPQNVLIAEVLGKAKDTGQGWICVDISEEEINALDSANLRAAA